MKNSDRILALKFSELYDNEKNLYRNAFDKNDIILWELTKSHDSVEEAKKDKTSMVIVRNRVLDNLDAPDTYKLYKVTISHDNAVVLGNEYVKTSGLVEAMQSAARYLSGDETMLEMDDEEWELVGPNNKRIDLGTGGKIWNNDKVYGYDSDRDVWVTTVNVNGKSVPVEIDNYFNFGKEDEFLGTGEWTSAIKVNGVEFNIVSFQGESLNAKDAFDIRVRSHKNLDRDIPFSHMDFLEGEKFREYNAMKTFERREIKEKSIFARRAMFWQGIGELIEENLGIRAEITGEPEIEKQQNPKKLAHMLNHSDFADFEIFDENTASLILDTAEGIGYKFEFKDENSGNEIELFGKAIKEYCERNENKSLEKFGEELSRLYARVKNNLYEIKESKSGLEILQNSKGTVSKKERDRLIAEKTTEIESLEEQIEDEDEHYEFKNIPVFGNKSTLIQAADFLYLCEKIKDTEGISLNPDLASDILDYAFSNSEETGSSRVLAFDGEKLYDYDADEYKNLEDAKKENHAFKTSSEKILEDAIIHISEVLAPAYPDNDYSGLIAELEEEKENIRKIKIMNRFFGRAYGNTDDVKAAYEKYWGRSINDSYDNALTESQQNAACISAMAALDLQDSLNNSDAPGTLKQEDYTIVELPENLADEILSGKYKTLGEAIDDFSGREDERRIKIMNEFFGRDYKSAEDVIAKDREYWGEVHQDLSEKERKELAFRTMAAEDFQTAVNNSPNVPTKFKNHDYTEIELHTEFMDELLSGKYKTLEEAMKKFTEEKEKEFLGETENKIFNAENLHFVYYRDVRTNKIYTNESDVLETKEDFASAAKEKGIKNPKNKLFFCIEKQELYLCTKDKLVSWADAKEHYEATEYFRSVSDKFEKEIIIQQSKDSGYYMLDPTGEKTKLSEDQWVFTQTKKGKELLKNWEYKAAADFATKTKPVAILTGKEFAKEDNVSLVDAVTNYYKKIYAGQISGNFAGTVVLNRKGVKDSIGHGITREKAVAYAAVPQVIQNGFVYERQTKWKNRNYDTAVVIAPISIAKNDYVMEIVLRKSTKTNNFYLHEVEIKDNLLELMMENPEQKKNDLQEGFKTTTQGAPSNKSRLIIAQHLDKVKNCDIEFTENFEPTSAEVEKAMKTLDERKKDGLTPKEFAEYLNKANNNKSMREISESEAKLILDWNFPLDNKLEIKDSGLYETNIEGSTYRREPEWVIKNAVESMENQIEENRLQQTSVEPTESSADELNLEALKEIRQGFVGKDQFLTKSGIKGTFISIDDGMLGLYTEIWLELPEGHPALSDKEWTDKIKEGSRQSFDFATYVDFKNDLSFDKIEEITIRDHDEGINWPLAKPDTEYFGPDEKAEIIEEAKERFYQEAEKSLEPFQTQMDFNEQNISLLNICLLNEAQGEKLSIEPTKENIEILDNILHSFESGGENLYMLKTDGYKKPEKIIVRKNEWLMDEDIENKPKTATERWENTYTRAYDLSGNEYSVFGTLDLEEFFNLAIDSEFVKEKDVISGWLIEYQKNSYVERINTFFEDTLKKLGRQPFKNFDEIIKWDEEQYGPYDAEESEKNIIKKAVNTAAATLLQEAINRDDTGLVPETIKNEDYVESTLPKPVAEIIVFGAYNTLEDAIKSHIERLKNSGELENYNAIWKTNFKTMDEFDEFRSLVPAGITSAAGAIAIRIFERNTDAVKTLMEMYGADKINLSVDALASIVKDADAIGEPEISEAVLDNINEDIAEKIARDSPDTAEFLKKKINGEKTMDEKKSERANEGIEPDTFADLINKKDFDTTIIIGPNAAEMLLKTADKIGYRFPVESEDFTLGDIRDALEKYSEKSGEAVFKTLADEIKNLVYDARHLIWDIQDTTEDLAEKRADATREDPQNEYLHGDLDDLQEKINDMSSELDEKFGLYKFDCAVDVYNSLYDASFKSLSEVHGYENNLAKYKKTAGLFRNTMKDFSEQYPVSYIAEDEGADWGDFKKKNSEQVRELLQQTKSFIQGYRMNPDDKALAEAFSREELSNFVGFINDLEKYDRRDRIINVWDLTDNPFTLLADCVYEWHDSDVSAILQDYERYLSENYVGTDKNDLSENVRSRINSRMTEWREYERTNNDAELEAVMAIEENWFTGDNQKKEIPNKVDEIMFHRSDLENVLKSFSDGAEKATSGPWYIFRDQENKVGFTLEYSEREFATSKDGINVDCNMTHRNFMYSNDARLEVLKIMKEINPAIKLKELDIHEKYIDLESLNKQWKTNFKTLDEFERYQNLLIGSGGISSEPVNSICDHIDNEHCEKIEEILEMRNRGEVTIDKEGISKIMMYALTRDASNTFYSIFDKISDEEKKSTMTERLQNAINEFWEDKVKDDASSGYVRPSGFALRSMLNEADRLGIKYKLPKSMKNFEKSCREGNLSIREIDEVKPTPVAVYEYNPDDRIPAEKLAEDMNDRSFRDAPKITSEQAEAILKYTDYEDYIIYKDSRGRLCVYDASEDFDGEGNVENVKGVVEFGKDMFEKAYDCDYNCFDPKDAEILKPIFDYYIKENKYPKHVYEELEKIRNEADKDAEISLKNLALVDEYTEDLDRVKFFVDKENKTILQQYYNPDATSGGQIVNIYSSFDELKKAVKALSNRTAFEDFDTELEGLSNVGTLTDVYREDFAEKMKNFHEIEGDMEMSIYDGAGIKRECLDTLIQQCDLEKELENELVKLREMKKTEKENPEQNITAGKDVGKIILDHLFMSDDEKVKKWICDYIVSTTMGNDSQREDFEYYLSDSESLNTEELSDRKIEELLQKHVSENSHDTEWLRHRLEDLSDLDRHGFEAVRVAESLSEIIPDPEYLRAFINGINEKEGRVLDANLIEKVRELNIKDVENRIKATQNDKVKFKINHDEKTIEHWYFDDEETVEIPSVTVMKNSFDDFTKAMKEGDPWATLDILASLSQDVTTVRQNEPGYLSRLQEYEKEEADCPEFVYRTGNSDAMKIAFQRVAELADIRTSETDRVLLDGYTERIAAFLDRNEDEVKKSFEEFIADRDWEYNESPKDQAAQYLAGELRIELGEQANDRDTNGDLLNEAEQCAYEVLDMERFSKKGTLNHLRNYAEFKGIVDVDKGLVRFNMDPENEKITHIYYAGSSLVKVENSVDDLAAVLKNDPQGLRFIRNLRNIGEITTIQKGMPGYEDLENEYESMSISDFRQGQEFIEDYNGEAKRDFINGLAELAEIVAINLSENANSDTKFTLKRFAKEYLDPSEDAMNREIFFVMEKERMIRQVYFDPHGKEGGKIFVNDCSFSELADAATKAKKNGRKFSHVLTDTWNGTVKNYYSKGTTDYILQSEILEDKSILIDGDTGEKLNAAETMYRTSGQKRTDEVLENLLDRAYGVLGALAEEKGMNIPDGKTLPEIVQMAVEGDSELFEIWKEKEYVNRARKYLAENSKNEGICSADVQFSSEKEIGITVYPNTDSGAFEDLMGMKMKDWQNSHGVDDDDFNDRIDCCMNPDGNRAIYRVPDGKGGYAEKNVSDKVFKSGSPYLSAIAKELAEKYIPAQKAIHDKTLSDIKEIVYKAYQHNQKDYNGMHNEWSIKKDNYVNFTLKHKGQPVFAVRDNDMYINEEKLQLLEVSANSVLNTVRDVLYEKEEARVPRCGMTEEYHPVADENLVFGDVKTLLASELKARAVSATHSADLTGLGKKKIVQPRSKSDDDRRGL